MAKHAPTIQLVTPRAAAYLWRRTEARMRRLRLDGKLQTRRVEGWGSKPFLAYSFESCRARWGEPDANRLALLLKVEVLQIAGDGGAVWELIAPRPIVVDDAGNLAVTLED